MRVGEVVSALSLCASSWYGEHLLMLMGVDSIEVGDETINICFTDGNTADITININGEIIHK